MAEVEVFPGEISSAQGALFWKHRTPLPLQMVTAEDLWDYFLRLYFARLFGAFKYSLEARISARRLK